MDATIGDEKPLRSASGGASQASVPAVQQHAAPLPAAGVAVEAMEGGSEDDEQVERFYALVANIRALRGLYGAGAGVGVDGARADCGRSGPAGRGRKRAREAEPPWRPAFRMEDFEEATVNVRCVMKMDTSDGARRPAGREGDTVADDNVEGDAAEARGRSGRRVAARGRSGIDRLGS
ncbi:NRR repressor homolog 1-like [Phragmites australis]|uniref:NRR repressor homolog 1-like n=1 Tax=Phragmites australis TaxID=29695 RepID=UPI002D781D53|nr:NRR repressor homolog 1-like [Phragmites australis]